MFFKNRACQFLRSIGLSSTESARFTSLIEKWHRESGPEWTTKRLKTLELYAKEKYLGENPPIPQGWATKTTRRYSKRFSDDLLHELFSSNEFDFSLAMNFCRLSTSMILAKSKNGKVSTLPPSKSQLTKMLTAIEGPVDKDINMSLDILGPFISKSVSLFNNKKIDNLPMMYWPMSDTSAPYQTMDMDNVETAPRNQNLDTWSVELLYTHSPLRKFFEKNQRYVSKCILGNGKWNLPLPSKAIWFEQNQPAGTISPIQELGCKLRPAANPWLVLQAINNPLKGKLENISINIPEIVTYNQESGRDTLLEWISQETQVWSLDASSFTDRFPLDFQKTILHELVKQDFISQAMYDVFDITSDMKYWFQPINRLVSYKFGQPQGLGPSFSLATLAHYVLVDALRMALNIKTKPFRVLGDDIIIANQDLAHAYMKWMDDCNVEINMTKSIISNSLGEFAGTQVTSDKKMNRPKLSELTSNDQFISWYDIHMSNGREFKHIDFMFKDASKFTEKIFLPEDLGGRRYDMSQVEDIQLLPLNQFSIVKTRLLKDIRKLIPYNKDEVISFLETKEKIKTGIIHSSYPYSDDPGLEDSIMIESQLQFEKSLLELEKAKIEDLKEIVQKFHDEVILCTDISILKTIVSLFKDTVNHHGYLTAEIPNGFYTLDFNNNLSKLVNDAKSYFDTAETIKRKQNRKPSNTGWKGHLSRTSR
jgi:hypothetical protein